MANDGPNMLEAATNETFELMFTDSFARFVEIQLSKRSSYALKQHISEQGMPATKGEWHGLADCFCLTDMNLPDQPIVVASDGFVAVTGEAK
jgi:hypothetical protein